MNTYTRFIIFKFFKSFLLLFIVFLALVFLLNLISELDFFQQVNANIYFPIYLSILNSPSLIFEMFPFIILLSTQHFFINISRYNQIEIFKYSGLKNSHILKIISFFCIILSLLIVIIFYNFSSNLKNFYLSLKSNYTDDDKYLAVVTNNGLWIKDKIDNKILIVNASKIENNFLIDTFITEFDQNYNPIRNIKSPKINIEKNKWKINDASIYYKNNKFIKDYILLNSNFNYKRIQSLFSNLSSLSVKELYKLKENYKILGYSTTEINIHLMKIYTYPINLLFMLLLASILMFKTKKHTNNTLKISIGIFLSVIIFYLNNFFSVLGNSEKVTVEISVFGPLIIIFFMISIMLNRINEY